MSVSIMVGIIAGFFGLLAGLWLVGARGRAEEEGLVGDDVCGMLAQSTVVS